MCNPSVIADVCMWRIHGRVCARITLTQTPQKYSQQKQQGRNSSSHGNPFSDRFPLHIIRTSSSPLSSLCRGSETLFIHSNLYRKHSPLPPPPPEVWIRVCVFECAVCQSRATRTHILTEWAWTFWAKMAHSCYICTWLKWLQIIKIHFNNHFTHGMLVRILQFGRY